MDYVELTVIENKEININEVNEDREDREIVIIDTEQNTNNCNCRRCLNECEILVDLMTVAGFITIILYLLINKANII